MLFDADIESRNRKRLGGIEAGFEFLPPLWELRVGDYRVYYDIDVSLAEVTLRAVRRKRPEETTQEVLS